MKELVYNNIRETVTFHKLRNGLSVYILPKKGYHKTFVTLSTPLGSNITAYLKDGVQYDVPMGVAHFLEHKLFDKGDYDVSEIFAQQGAQVNAYTMNTRTTYLFSCTEHINENIETLIDFVFRPVFTEDGIQSEIDIITQEIKMYEDDSNAAVYMGVLQNLYHTHPVQHEILGTEDSISTITKELLEDVHKTFYHPSNMVLFVTGNVDVTNVIKVVENSCKHFIPTIGTIPNPVWDEPSTVQSKHAVKEMDVRMANTIIGYKLRPNKTSPHSIMKQELIYSMLLDLVFGKSTEAYEQLLEEQLINDSFGMDVTIEPEYSFLLLGGQTQKPDELCEAIQRIIKESAKNGLNPEHFVRTKKQIIGGFIQALNSLEYIANQFTKYHFMGGNLFKVLEMAQSITIEDIDDAFAVLMDPKVQTSFTILPQKKA